MFKKYIRNIPHVTLCVNMLVFELAVFAFYRLFFLKYMSIDIHEKDNSLIFYSFLSGLRFDLVVICYSLALPFVLLSINHALNYKFWLINNIVKYFTIIVLVFYQFIWAADIPYYKQFGNHLNKQALLWKDEGAFVIGFIFENISYWGFLLLFIILAIVSLVVFNYFYKKFYINITISHPQTKTSQFIQFTILGALLFLGIRGTTSQKTTIHEGFSIICSNQIINNTGLNPNFTFLKSILKSNYKNIYIIPKNIDSDITYSRKYLNITSSYEKTINRTIITNDDSITPYNVVIVIMESMSIAKMGYYGYPNLTPHLNQLNKKSIFFSNFFSSGIHTFNGLFSVTTGFPAIYDEQSLKRYTKKSFNGLGLLLKTKGYETYFGTTHDSQFDNMEGFFRLNHFDNIISQSTMPSKYVISTLGVPDHVLYNEFISQVNKQKTKIPFLGVLMSSSDHGPWKIPNNTSFKPTGNNEQENCTLYADWAIGQFMAKAKQQAWYNNTIFIFVGDHGFNLNHTYEMPISYNHIPCIIHQPRKLQPDTISTPCYQPDIPATVMGLLGYSYTNETFGINILKEKHPFVVFSADDKIGCVDNQGYFYYKMLNNSERYLRKYTNLDSINYINYNFKKADSLEKNMMHIYQSANYFIKKEYYLPQ